MSTVTVEGEGVVLDAILARKFGAVRARSLVAETLGLNPGLASLGPVLPLGTVITLPNPPSVDTFTARPVVSLFG